MRTRCIGVTASVVAALLVAGWFCVAICWLIRVGPPQGRGSQSGVVGGVRVGIDGVVRQRNVVVASYSIEWVEDRPRVVLQRHGEVEVRFWDLWGNPMEEVVFARYYPGDDIFIGGWRAYRGTVKFVPPRRATHFTLGLGRPERTTPKAWIPR